MAISAIRDHSFTPFGMTHFGPPDEDDKPADGDEDGAGDAPGDDAGDEGGEGE